MDSETVSIACKAHILLPWAQHLDVGAAKLVAAGILALWLSGCSTPPKFIEERDAPIQTGIPVDAKVIDIKIATSREPSDELGEFFSASRSSSVNYAQIDVSIPSSHQTGQVELPRQLPADPDEHFVLFNAERINGADRFLQEVNAAVRSRPKGQRSAMVFIHGYNTNVTEAVARLGQIVQDSGYTGIPILFTWPSAGRQVDYVTDINSATFSRDALAELIFLMNRSRADRFDVIAHSMGNYLLMETARSLALQGRIDNTGRLGTVLLAAPDIDVDVFEKQLAPLPKSIRQKIVILVSRDDKALRLSRRIAGGNARLGASDIEQLDQLGVRAIDITEIEDRSSLSHSKFADSPEIVHLIGQRMAEGNSLTGTTSTTGLVAQQFGNVLSVALDPN